MGPGADALATLNRLEIIGFFRFEHNKFTAPVFQHPSDVFHRSLAAERCTGNTGL
jgi:hypothetical protein